MRDVLAIILAGGGENLLTLTRVRAKASVPFAGRYRLIDFALSNCAHSGITNVAVLAQYLPESLKAHVGIGRPWDLDRHDGGLRLLEPYLAGGDTRWYGGTADALAQNVEVITEPGFTEVMVLAGGHVYRMDYRPLLEFHRDAGADLTVVLQRAAAGRDGAFRLRKGNALAAAGAGESAGAYVPLSIFVFRRAFLVERLRALGDVGAADIVADLVTAAVSEGRAYGFVFDGYWSDIPTFDDYYDVTFDFLAADVPFGLDDASWPLYTKYTDEPPAKFGPGAAAAAALVANGCIINGRVENSVLFRRVYVEESAVVRNAIIMDETHIGPGAVVEGAVLDKLVRVGAGAHVGADVGEGRANDAFPDALGRGVTVVGKRAQVPPAFVVGRNCLLDVGVALGAGEGKGVLPNGRAVLAAEGD